MEENNSKMLERTERIIVDLKKKQMDCTELTEINRCLRSYHCYCCYKNNDQKHLNKSIFRNFLNYIKSSLPQRLLFHEDGEWRDFPAHIIQLIQEDFEKKKAITDVVFEGRHLLFDFIHMVQIDTVSGSHKPLAWIDEHASCFFPEIYPCFCNSCVDNGRTLEEDKTPLSLLNDSCETNVKLENPSSPAESSTLDDSVGTCYSVKKIKSEDDPLSFELEQCTDVGENEPSFFIPLRKSTSNILNENVYIANLAIGGKAYTTVQKLLLQGMYPFIDAKDIVGIFNIPPASSLWQKKLELFKKRVVMTTNCRGNATVRYAWLACPTDAVVDIMSHGLRNFVQHKHKPMHGMGIHLAPASRANISVSCLDVDEKGLVHLVLCRVVLGNLEVVQPESKQFQPSSGSFDNGVDNFHNPNHYIIWDVNMETHILPEYAVSFRLHSEAKAKLLGKVNMSAVPASFNDNLQGHSFNMENKQPAHHWIENRQLLTVLSSVVERQSQNTQSGLSRKNSPRGPTSPWLPIPILLSAISNQVTAQDMDRARFYHDKFKRNSISRTDLIRKLRMIIGDKLLVSTIIRLQHKVPYDEVAEDTRKIIRKEDASEDENNRREEACQEGNLNRELGISALEQL